jgi:(S)-ureidoglycine aminohydrolase
MTLNPFGHTRTRVTPTHALLSPDGHVTTSLPGWEGTGAVVLISPQLGARFTQVLAHLSAGGRWAGAVPGGGGRFLFVVSGEVKLELEGKTHTLPPHGYAYLPPNTPHTVRAPAPATLCVFERRYVPLDGAGVPESVVGVETERPGEPFLGDEGVRVRKLLPEAPAFDLMVSTMTFAPGASLPYAETHVMEHGLLMLSGGGVYRLAESWYPVSSGDAIYMAPYCPQWFGALGKVPSTYLLYKDGPREPFALEAGS